MMALGAVLVMMALALFSYNSWDAKRAEKAAESVMEQIKNEIQAEEDSDSYTDYTSRTMKVITIDGHDYIGYISIPAIDLELPVMAEWSDEGLKIAPGRYVGSVYTNNLVIAGHNYISHFSPIKWLETGTEVDFIDVEQNIWKYEVSEVETLQPMQVEEMITKTENDNWDLTLFTCNTGGQSRCTVRCILKKNQIKENKIKL